jgi:putative oxidoreductase
MKHLPTIAGVLLGLVFLMASVPLLLGMEQKPPPEAPPQDVITFMTLFMSTGYLKFVKVFELIGGILVAIPRTRNLGLLVLGPVIVNILGFDMLVAKGWGMNQAMPLVMTALVVILPLYLLWVERKAFAGLVNRSPEN